MKNISIVLMALTLMAAVSCTTIGKKFSSDHVTDIFLGSTTPYQIHRWFGEPRTSYSVNLNGIESEIHEYKYAKDEGKPFGEARVVSRQLVVEFVDETVNAFFFTSSLKDDATDFDIGARSSLKIGESTKLDAQRALGTPGGCYNLPTNLLSPESVHAAPDSAVYAVIYFHSYTTRRDNLFVSPTKRLTLFFDSRDLLVHMDYFEGEF